jgi:hypothetical protein
LKGIAEGTYNSKHAEAARLYYTTTTTTTTTHIHTHTHLQSFKLGHAHERRCEPNHREQHAQREAGENTFYSKRTRSIVRDHMLGAKHEGQHEGLGRIDLQRSERTGSHIKSLFPVSHMARWSERSPDTCRSIKCGDGGSCDSSRSQCHTEWLCGIAHQHGRCFGCMCKWGSLVLFCMFCLAGLF